MIGDAVARAADIAAATQLACLLEASAAKPGNVSPGRPFTDLAYEHFLASAAAIGTAFARAGDLPLGQIVLDAIAATARWTGTNSNLGIVLLLAPLAKAATTVDALFAPDSEDALREALRRLLAATTIDDARQVYAAIRLARPGGLGSAPEQDVAGEPTQTLAGVMGLAADRDGIAREYASTFAATFEVGVPALRRARADGLDWNDATVETFLKLLAHAPDTHVIRRGGSNLGRQVSTLAAQALDAGGVRTPDGRLAITALDGVLRDDRHIGNPGTTADLTAAVIFVFLACGGFTRTPRL